jgi:DNA repair ATPase RecN
VTPEQLPAVRDEYVAKQEALSGGGSQIKQARCRATAAREAYLTAARKLSKSREGAAKSWKPPWRRTAPLNWPCQVPRRAGTVGR